MFISVIPQSHCRIIERFGKPVKVQGSGLAFRIPLLDYVKLVPKNWGGAANENRRFIQLTEQILDTKSRECITQDNAKVLVSSIIRWRIIDPIKAVYELDNLLLSLTNAVLNTLRAEIGKMKLDSVLSAREGLAERIIADLTETSYRWGVKIVSLEIQEITTDNATASAMLLQMEAERESRAIVSKAEGTATALIKTAEADKTAAILKAEALQESLAIIADAEKDYLDRISLAVGPEAAARLLMASKVLDGYKTISANPAHKIYVPNSIEGIVNFDDTK